MSFDYLYKETGQRVVVLKEAELCRLFQFSAS